MMGTQSTDEIARIARQSLAAAVGAVEQSLARDQLRLDRERIRMESLRMRHEVALLATPFHAPYWAGVLGIAPEMVFTDAKNLLRITPATKILVLHLTNRRKAMEGLPQGRLVGSQKIKFIYLPDLHPTRDAAEYHDVAWASGRAQRHAQILERWPVIGDEE